MNFLRRTMEPSAQNEADIQEYVGTIICNKDLTAFGYFIPCGEKYDGPLPTLDALPEAINVATEMVMMWHTKEPALTIYGSVDGIKKASSLGIQVEFRTVICNRFSFIEGQFEVDYNGEYEDLFFEAKSDSFIKMVALRFKKAHAVNWI